MTEKDSESPFDAAAKAYKSKGKKKSTSPPPPKEKLPPATAEEIDAQFRLTQQRYEEIQAKARQALSAASVDPDRLSQFLRNPDRFTPEAWRAMEQVRYDEEKALAARVGIAAQKASEDKARQSKAKKTRRKFIGQRKNWLKMD